ncbi:MAG: hypothetical protein ABI220_03710 [Candidatus Saccharimonadales bacterium]
MPEPKPKGSTDQSSSPYGSIGLDQARIEAIKGVQSAVELLKSLGNTAITIKDENEPTIVDEYQMLEAETHTNDEITTSVFEFTRKLPLANGHKGFRSKELTVLRLTEATVWWVKQPKPDLTYGNGYTERKPTTWRGRGGVPVFVIGEHIIRDKNTSADAEIELLLTPASSDTQDPSFLKIKTSLAKYSRSDELAMQRLIKPINNSDYSLYNFNPETGMYTLNRFNAYGSYYGPNGKFRTLTTHVWGSRLNLLNVPEDYNKLLAFNCKLDKGLRKDGVERDGEVYEEIELTPEVINTFGVLDTTMKLAALFAVEPVHAEMVKTVKEASKLVIW